MRLDPYIAYRFIFANSTNAGSSSNKATESKYSLMQKMLRGHEVLKILDVSTLVFVVAVTLG